MVRLDSFWPVTKVYCKEGKMEEMVVLQKQLIVTISDVVAVMTSGRVTELDALTRALEVVNNYISQRIEFHMNAH